MRTAPATFLFLLAFLLASVSTYGQETVRVLVMDDLPGLTLHIPKEYEVEDKSGSGCVTEEKDGGRLIVLDRDHTPSGALRITAGPSSVNVNEFSMRGLVEVKRNSKGLYRIVNELGLEDYTRAVVGEEMAQSWPAEALKAQAVVARTYTLYRKRKCGGEDYDLCATVNSQMFTGDAREKEGPAQAARATEGEVLMYGNELVETVYHSSCGGTTESADAVWDWPRPYLKPQACQCQQESPYAQWERAVSPDEIEKALRAGGYDVDGVNGIKVLDRSRTGRVRLMKVKAASGSATLKGLDFRRLVGYAKLPSTCFEVRREGVMFVFAGRGSGHGVGLCQWGAKVMAEQGKSYREILEHYYPGTVLTRLGDAR